MQFIFIVYQVEGYRNTLKTTWTPLLFSQNYFKKQKSSGTILPASFSASFLRKIFLWLPSIDKQFHFMVVYNSWAIGQYLPCYCLLVRLLDHKFWNFEIKLVFLFKLCYTHDKKVRKKNYLQNKKSF